MPEVIVRRLSRIPQAPTGLLVIENKPTPIQPIAYDPSKILSMQAESGSTSLK
jgi:hypothetical protein